MPDPPKRLAALDSEYIAALLPATVSASILSTSGFNILHFLLSDLLTLCQHLILGY